MQSIANLAKGQDRGNAVTIQVSSFIYRPKNSNIKPTPNFKTNIKFPYQTVKSKENGMWILQDSCTNSYESMVVYAPVDITGMQSVITGCDSSNIALLPSGFSILPDGVESRPLVITSRQEKSTEGGSLLTIAFQITNNSPTSRLTIESVESVNTLISCTLRSIKSSLKCEDV